MSSSYSVQKPSPSRSGGIALFDALPAAHTMSALVEVDVTELRRSLRERRRKGGKATFMSAILWAVGRSLVEFPEFNSMRWGRRIATFNGVDVPVELRRGGESVVECVLIRSAERLSLEEISALIEDFKNKGMDAEASTRDTHLQRFLHRLPRFLLVPVLRKLNTTPGYLRKFYGTTIVTSIDQGSRIPAWALPLSMGSRAVIFALGNTAPKPVVVGREVVVRDILHLTVQVNHDVVDGASSARFAQRLVRNIQEAGKG